MSEFRSGKDFARGELFRRRKVKVVNKLGLHARAAAKFVKAAAAFDAEITVIKDGDEVSGLSIMGLMMLAATPGCDIEINASGPKAEEALDALEKLVVDGFDEK